MKRLVLLLLTVIFVFGHAPQCVIETKDGIIDLNNAKHEKYQKTFHFINLKKVLPSYW